jgi:mRNA interferase MazF
MAYLGAVGQWDVFWADLDPAVGSEQAGESRPVLVVSNNGANSFFRVVTVVPLTKLEGKGRKVKRFEVELPKGIVGNDYTSIALPFQIRTIDKKRLLEKVGHLTDQGARDRLEKGILEHLGIAFDDE